MSPFQMANSPCTSYLTCIGLPSRPVIHPVRTSPAARYPSPYNARDRNGVGALAAGALVAGAGDVGVS